MTWRTFVVVLCVGLVWGWLVPKAEAADNRIKRSRASHKSLPTGAPDANIGKEGNVAAQELSSRRVQRATPASARGGESRDPKEQDLALVRSSEGLAGEARQTRTDGSGPPAGQGNAVSAVFPRPSGYPGERATAGSGPAQASTTPSLIDRSHIGALLTPEASLKSVGRFPTGPESGFSHLEIEVSHSAHTFRLYGHAFFGGKREVLHECKVGLGGPGFPTPVGVYYVTHIFDEDPWWIPPKDRAWAAGDSPSRRVYGGTMAPLLKKRDVRTKSDPADPEDKISGPVKLEDYGYRFHGTNAPRSIGRNQSHGCVRMLPDDARKVANLIKERVGISQRKQAENGAFVVLSAPVRLNLIK